MGEVLKNDCNECYIKNLKKKSQYGCMIQFIANNNNKIETSSLPTKFI